ncbi:LysR family transcriptional regulator [Nocardioides litoris]|uniref:LysR family transcriptional regulator n=1 Tax=Nocardioides litoris TaxID=1926648 RepID=UPI00111CC12A|nr:LysR family transcriptional regulator [Nocardioides litoris]
MDVRRLRLLLELSRLGSMREVAEELGTTTSTVSQGIAALAAEVGCALVEPEGRRVRLTPAGTRLAEHAVHVIAAIEAARADLDPAARPSGVVRVAGFATAVRRSLLPAVERLAAEHPAVEVRVLELEPQEALEALHRDDLDLALAYDYDLAPHDWSPDLEATALWQVAWGLGVPDADRGSRLADFADRPFVVNSRGTGDERVLRTLGALAGFAPRVVHRVDSLDLVDDLVVAGLGVALLPTDRRPRTGVRVLPLTDPPVLRAHAVVRRGRATWPPVRAVLERLR